VEGSRIGGYEGVRGEVGIGIGVSRLRLRRMCRLGNGGGVWKCRSFFGDGLCPIGHVVWRMRRVL
jgi:hypothetical protein